MGVNHKATKTQREPGDPAALRAFDIVGTAADPADVEIVIDNVVPGSPPGHQQGPWFHEEVEVAGSAASYHAVAVKEGGVEAAAGSVFVAARQRTPAYDAHGNLDSDGRWIYDWDAEHRLVAAETDPALDPAIPRQRVEIAYDYRGRRIARTASHWHPASSSWVVHADWKFVYDGWNVVARLDAADADSLDHAYVWGTDLSGSAQGAGGVGGLLLVRDANTGNDHAPCYDGNGNVTALYRVAGPATNPGPSATYDYDAFGNTIRATGPFAEANRHRFSTKPEDPATGLVYYGFRHYNPVTGRWLSRDPIGERGGLNLYGLVENNPVAFFDYLGQVKKGAGILKIGFLGANPFHFFHFGDQTDVPTPRWVDGSGIMGEADETFESTHVSRAKKYVIEHFDITGDGQLDENDCPPFDLRVVGFSWGGWSALELSHNLSKSRKIRIKEHLEIRLGTLDPVSTGRRSRVGPRSPLGHHHHHRRRPDRRTRVGTKAERVVKLINYYETNGLLEASAAIRWAFSGSPVRGAVNHNVTREDLGHLQIVGTHGAQLVNEVFGN